MSLNGSHVYMRTQSSNYLYEASTSNHSVIGKIGPFNNAVRPFTINGNETYAFVSTTRFLGFSVGDISTGKVLYTVACHRMRKSCMLLIRSIAWCTFLMSAGCRQHHQSKWQTFICKIRSGAASPIVLTRASETAGFTTAAMGGTCSWVIPAM